MTVLPFSLTTITYAIYVLNSQDELKSRDVELETLKKQLGNSVESEKVRNAFLFLIITK